MLFSDVFARSTCLFVWFQTKEGRTRIHSKVVKYSYIIIYMNILRFKCIPIYLSIFCIYMFVYECFCIYRADHKYTYNYIYMLYDIHYEISIYRHIYIYLLYILHTGVRHSKPARLQNPSSEVPELMLEATVTLLTS